MENIKSKYQVVNKIMKKDIDKQLLNSVLILVGIGFFAIFSASLPMCLQKNINPFHYIIQHIFWIALGGAGLYWFSNFNYRKLPKYTFPFALTVIVLLLLVKFSFLGVTINGARRWLNFGFFQFQPSELTKISAVMLLSSMFSIKSPKFETLFKYILVLLIMLFIVLKQPNLSMVLILFGIGSFMYICAGKTLKFIFMGLILLICLYGLIKMDIIDITKYLEPHQVSRILNWNNSNSDIQGEGYQVFHSRIAVASGNLFGEGYGASKEKLGWLPEAHTDFIFSVIAEEMGFVGCFMIICLFLVILQRGLSIAHKSPDIYGKLLAIGITISITTQAFLNIAVATSLLPATGITLPFISYGGSSLFVSMSMIGILLNISKTREKSKLIKLSV